MLDVQMEGKVAVIDVRERALKGEHPGDELIEYIRQAPNDIVFEIHVPHEAKPLVKKLDGIGMNVILNKVTDGHYYLVVTKLD